MAAPDRDFHEALLEQLGALYTMARWLTRSGIDAEDLVQETCARALRFRHRFRPGTNFRAWLFQISRNTFLTQAKRRGRAPRPYGMDELEAMAAAGPREVNPGRAEPFAGVDVDAALDLLPEEYRTTVLLADLEGFTMAEIAGIMGCPVGTVKSRLSRARGLLRQLLRDYGA